jgi:alpha-tubulin suppressor-like RCC1 family protein
LGNTVFRSVVLSLALSCVTGLSALAAGQAPSPVPSRVVASPSVIAPSREAVRAPTLVPGIEHVVDAAIGNHFFIVALQDGSVMTWGYNNAGQLGNGHVGATSGSEPGKTMAFVVQAKAEAIDAFADVVAVAAGAEHGLALRRDGSVMGWGSNGSGQLALGKSNRGANPTPVAIPGVTRATAIAAYGNASFALLDDGTVVGWGESLWRSGARAVSSETPIAVPGIAGATAIRAGLPSLALLRDGTVMAWGTGVLGDGSGCHAA